MNNVEFRARLAENGSIHVPPDAAGRIPKDQEVRVVVVLDETEIEASDDEIWRSASEQSLLAAYAEEDSIYDRLYTEPDVR